MDDYVAKPVRAKDLFAVLEKLYPGRARRGQPAPAAPAASAAAGPDTAPDEADILSRVDGDRALLKELSALFFAEYPKLLTQLREAATSRSGDPLRKTAHALKGMLSSLGARDAAAATAALEGIATDGDASDVGEAYATLEKEIDRFARALTSLLEAPAK